MMKNENGFTLAEVLATAVIIIIASIAMYYGIVHAERQIVKNYHDRVAIMHASGELDWQKYYKNTYNGLSPFGSKSVVIDEYDNRGPLLGVMEYKQLGLVPPDVVIQNLHYEAVEISVRWTEPSDKKQRKVVLREDFY
ncbi:MAG: prepilin-type N-terminal cleavage/methylation domain-containing protein [Candidatus Cloacimonetes bacterium]|nr:prepilin-type N-terminal cleavage/methylation domain-containing protein [Candidatus Cloacimonadota bacterium]